MNYFRVTLSSVMTLVLLACNEHGKPAGGASTFYVDTVKSGAMTTRFNSWGLPSEKQYGFTACLKDTGLMAPIFNQAFSVGDDAGGTRQAQTDSRGCLQWSELHSYDHFAPETFLLVRRRITALGQHRGAIDLNLALNPWTDQVLDLRFDAAPAALTSSGGKEFTSPLGAGAANLANLDLKSLSLQFLAVDYSAWEVNPHLSLNVAHNYRLRFAPSVFRRGLARPFVEEKPAAGRLRLTLILTNESEFAKVITSASAVVEMQAGGVTHDLALTFADISSVSSRMRAFVKLEPMIDGSTSVGAAVFTAPFGPLPSSAEMRTVPSSLTLQEFDDLFNKAAPLVEMVKPLDLFAAKSGFRRVAPAFANANVVLTGKAYKATGATLLRQLCQYVYGKPSVSAHDDEKEETKKSLLWPFGDKDKSDRVIQAHEALSQCLRRPADGLAVAVREFVEDLGARKVRRSGPALTETFSIQSSLVISESQTDSSGESEKTTWGWGADLNGNIGLGVGIDIGLGDLISNLIPVKASAGVKAGLSGKIAYGQEWFTSRARTLSTSQSHSASSTVNRTLTVEGYALDLDVFAKRCMLVAPLLKIHGQKDAKPQAFFFCEDGLTRKTAREVYYLVNQSLSTTSPIVDGASASEGQLRAFLRGVHTYQSFKATLSNAALELVLDPVRENDKSSGEATSESLDDTGASSDYHMNQDFPGMLSGT